MPTSWRLHGLTDLDNTASGYSWTAVYDGLGRRLQTSTILVTNGVSVSAMPKVINQYFDPAAEFLELGETDNGVTSWKIYGPDLNGAYGGMNGVGGLEAVVTGTQSPAPVVSDVRGNLYASYNLPQGSLVWNSSRPTGFGAVPGYRVLPLGQGAEVAAASAWRGKWSDISGLYWLGARYYDPIAGRFLGAEPLGHDTDPSLYTFCGGDPVNSFDSDGRLTTAALSANQSVTGPYINAATTGILNGLADWGFSAFKYSVAASAALNGSPPGASSLSTLEQSVLGDFQGAIQSGVDQHTSGFSATQGNIYAVSGFIGEMAPNIALLLFGGEGAAVPKGDVPPVIEPTVTPPPSVTVPAHLDIGGEGRYPDAVNLNPQTTTSTTPGQPIPNLISGVGERIPYPNQSIPQITLENAPITSQTASEIVRVIQPGGQIQLVSPSEYAVTAHQAVIDAVGQGATVTQTTANGITTTIIKVPGGAQ